MPDQQRYDVFLSYRRDGGEMLAKLLHDQFSRRRLRAFLDVEALRSGPFNTKLLDVIERCTDFVLILPPGALDRCQNEGDWVRLEIEHAMKLKKNIIPVMMRGFQWPEKLPDSIASLSLYNGVSASHEYFDAAIGKLLGMMKTPAKTRRGLTRGILLAAVITVALAGLAITGAQLFKPEYYTFADPSVEMLVRNALGKETGGITQAELNTVTQLPGPAIWDGQTRMDGLGTGSMISSTEIDHEEDYDLHSLEDFRHLPALERLNLDSSLDTTGMTDISPLGSLTRLKVLDLSDGAWNQPLQGLEALSRLTSLTHLDLEGCEISDITPLAALHNLEMLDLSRNQITDVSSLASMTRLTALDLNHNSIADLSPLAGLTEMRCLNLLINQVEDLSALGNMTKLTELDLRENKLTGLATLPRFPMIQGILLAENSLSDISPLGDIPTLREVSLAYNYRISDLSPLLKLPALKSLIFFQYQNFTPFEQIVALQEKGCGILLEENQKQALQLYQNGSYLAKPRVRLKAEEPSDPGGARDALHGYATLSMLNGQVHTAVANSLYLMTSDLTAATGFTANQKPVGFNELAELSLMHDPTEELHGTYALRDGQTGLEAEMPFSYLGVTGTLCFINGDGAAMQVRMQDVTRIQFDWTQVPDVGQAYFRIQGDGVDDTVPQAGIRLAYSLKENYSTKWYIESDLPLMDNGFFDFDKVESVELRSQADGAVSVRYRLLGDTEEKTDTLAFAGVTLFALGRDSAFALGMEKVYSITRVRDPAD